MSDFQYTLRTFYGKEVLFRSYDGQLTAGFEIEMLKYAVENGLINKNVRGMVLDMTSAHFNMEISEVRKIVDYVSADISLSSLKFAIIADTAEKVIFPLVGGIYKEQVKVRPFSTENAAIKWILT